MPTPEQDARKGSNKRVTIKRKRRTRKERGRAIPDGGTGRGASARNGRRLQREKEQRREHRQAER